MKRKKFTGPFLALALVLSLLAGCGNTGNRTHETQRPASAIADESAASTDAE